MEASLDWQERMTIDSNEHDQLKSMRRIDAFLQRNPGCLDFVRWLDAHGKNVERALSGALGRLTGKNRHLEGASLDRYVSAVIFNEFFVAWLEKHKGRSWETVGKSRTCREDRGLFESAIILVTDAKAFRRAVLTMPRKRKIAGRPYWTGDDFEGYVAGASSDLARKMMSNFDLSKSRSAVKYLGRMATSRFLRRFSLNIPPRVRRNKKPRREVHCAVSRRGR